MFKDPFVEYCDDNGKYNPFFMLPEKSINEDIFDAINEMDNYKFEPVKDVSPNHKLPDGAILFQDFSKKK